MNSNEYVEGMQLWHGAEGGWYRYISLYSKIMITDKISTGHIAAFLHLPDGKGINRILSLNTFISVS
jgi:hypothetical protein